MMKWVLTLQLIGCLCACENAASPGGCTKDTDCRAPRICVAWVCQDPTADADQSDGGLDGGGLDGLDSGSTVRVSVKAVEHCPVDPPVSPGLSRVSPTAARAGVLRLELLRTRRDAAPVSVALASQVVDLDLFAGGVVGAGTIIPGTYRFVRVSLVYGSVTVPAVAHPGGAVAAPGLLEYDVATATYTSAGHLRSSGEIKVTFTATGGPGASYVYVVPLDCPLSEAGGVVDITGSAYQVMVPVPGGELVVGQGDPAHELSLNFPLSGAVTWQDLATAGYAAGTLDIVGSTAGSETPLRLPICDLFLSDRCEPTATPTHSAPAWPMPDSATTACTNGAVVSTCPAPGAAWSGQDGCYSINASHLVVDGEVVRDQVTGLVWQRDAAPGDLDWWAARDYCRALMLGARPDWYLPSRLELATLLDNGRFGPSIDVAAFPGAASDFYWSSSPCLFTGLAFGIRFDQGFVYDHDPKTTAKVRCVAGGSTGTASRLVASADTVHDTSTGLVWQRTLHSQATWHDALSACEALSLAGATDWRLPTHKELLTIVEDTALTPSIDVTAFPDTPAEWQWASSAGFAPPTYAWSVSFTDGFSSTAAVTQLYSFRCVRGP